MALELNPYQLVLRLDSATGFARVGWAADLPMGRFIHVELIAESYECGPISPGHPLYEEFNRACHHAQQLNQPLIAAQMRDRVSHGCLPVPLDLNDPDAATAADPFGSYREPAMRALFRLTGNSTTVWAAVKDDQVLQLHTTQPSKPMEELQFQVWKRRVMKLLDQYGGQIIAGNLVVQESGLWLCPA